MTFARVDNITTTCHLGAGRTSGPCVDRKIICMDPASPAFFRELLANIFLAVFLFWYYLRCFYVFI